MLVVALDLHPTFRGGRFTLRGLYHAEAPARAKAQQLEEAGMRVYAFADRAPDGDDWFHVAAKHDVTPRGRATGIPHDHTALWDAVRMSVQAFREVNRGALGRGGVRWYKDLDVDVLRRTLQRIDWTGSHLDVATRIVSDLILAHPFPNANHRTSIFLARKYLASVEINWPSYSLRGRGNQRLHRETKSFFIGSKYLLQLYRHLPLVRAAVEAGYRALLIGSGAEAGISAADLDLRRPQIQLRHRAATRQMLISQASAAQEPLLLAPRTKALRDWVRHVRRTP